MNALIAFGMMRKDMGRKKTILPGAQIDGRKYLEEIPQSCEYCYWWQGKNKGCILPECYYLMPETKQESEYSDQGNCDNCPYGKHAPCIGYCIAKIQKEMREKKGGGYSGANVTSGKL